MCLLIDSHVPLPLLDSVALATTFVVSLAYMTGYSPRMPASTDHVVYCSSETSHSENVTSALTWVSDTVAHKRACLGD